MDEPVHRQSKLIGGGEKQATCGSIEYSVVHEWVTLYRAERRGERHDTHVENGTMSIEDTVESVAVESLNAIVGAIAGGAHAWVRLVRSTT